MSKGSSHIDGLTGPVWSSCCRSFWTNVKKRTKERIFLESRAHWLVFRRKCELAGTPKPSLPPSPFVAESRPKAVVDRIHPVRPSLETIQRTVNPKVLHRLDRIRRKRRHSLVEDKAEEEVDATIPHRAKESPEVPRTETTRRTASMPPVGARLRQFAPQWEDMFPHSSAAQIVRDGICVKFVSKPKLTRCPVQFPT